MHLLCPNCRNPIELVEARPREVACPSCGSSFRLEDASTTAHEPLRGRRLGRFELLDTVGVGAFGTVYKARDPALDRPVAVKVPRAGNLGDGQDLDRFLREARSAAQLRHPSIVTVHEVGQDGGLPYLVSDFVEGHTLADLLTSRRPGFRESAELVAAVADALQYAHEQGVVHRDVKPSNIMIGPGGVPAVTDFGLAKRDAGEVTVTLDGQVLGTPAYMPPEQARGEAHAVDGRGDVYSLGVVLYQMLTGELPFRGNSRMLLHQVLQDEPRPPRGLNDRIPRDLETVCLKAMAKEPARRYPTAGELAADLRRFLAGEPVRARPAGRAEKAWRWARRNPTVAGLTAAVFLLLLAIAGGAVAAAVRIDAARDQAVAQRAEAERQRERAEANFRRARQAVDDFYTRVNARLGGSPGLQPLRRELLTTAARYYQQFVEDRGDDPALRAELALGYWRLAGVVSEIGSRDEAAALYQKALGVQEQLAADHPGEREYRNDLAATCNNLGLLLAGTGERDRGLALVRRAVDLREQLVRETTGYRPYQRNLASGYSNLASVLHRDDVAGGPEAAAAREAHEKALALREAMTAAAPDDLELQDELTHTYNNLGAWHYRHGTPADALRWYEQARALRAKLLAKADAPGRRLELAKTHHNLGLLFRVMGKPAEALAAQEEAAALLEPLVRDNPQVTEYRRLLAEDCNSQGVLHAEAGRKPEALRAFGRAAELREEVARAHPGVRPFREELGRGWMNLGAMHQQAGQLVEAAAALQKARDVYEPLAREDPDDGAVRRSLALTFNNLGAVQSDSGDREQALRTYDRAEREYRELLAKDPDSAQTRSDLAAVWENRGITLGRLGRWEEALAAYKQAVDGQRLAAARAPDRPRFRRHLADHWLGVADAQRALGRPADAATALRAGLDAAAGYPEGLYGAAAGFARCVPLAGKGKPEPDADDRAERQRYAALAVEALRRAVAAGFADAARLKTDAALDPLRGSEDFRKLLAEVEAKAGGGGK